jgi:ATP-binding cassette subfamily B protein
VRIFNLAKHLSSRYRDLAHTIYTENAALITKRALGGAGLGLIALAGYYVGFLNILNVATIGRITIGTFTFLTGSLARTRMSTQRVFSYLNGVTEQALLLTDLFDILRLRPEIRSRSSALPIPHKPRIGFEFRNVRFAYPGSERAVVNGLNLRIKPSEKIALVGDNGAGKSTIVKLLCRLYEPVSGQILLDGIDLREYDLAELRESIGVLFQDYVRYDLNVRDNIGFGSLPDAGDADRLLNAASRAGAATLIKALPQQWEQMLGRRFGSGVDISGGEWQKIAMSRAMMTDDLLLVLDEPTASFDAEAEENFTQELQAHTGGPAIIIISHKLSIARLADRIIVLQKGVIVEEGSHSELMEGDGRYAQLFRIQASGFSSHAGIAFDQEVRHVPC